MPGQTQGRTPGESPTSPRRIEAAEKRVRALQLRKAGATYQQIADQVGYADRGRAYHEVMKELDDLPKDAAREVLALDLERLDQLLVGLWPAAAKGHVRSVETVIRVMERRARLLGLDAPIKSQVQVITMDVVEAEIIRLEAELAERADTDAVRGAAGDPAPSA